MIEICRTAIADALADLGLDPAPIQLDRTKQLSFGDLATNAPLVYAKQAGMAPMDLAQEIKDRLDLDPKFIAGVALASPGFINFTLADDYLRDQLPAIIKGGPDYGQSTIGAGKRAMVEFVSANPTGPLTVGHGRGAILGDVVSNILAWNGYQVEREYYYNDAGRQMRVLGASVQ
ncbi:MAG: arginine--tRNA ligase, partial [Candidatus Marinimicrobia bacterium]|nr:arginine--tRNA ligase [Candidatus Neomarinimicrobiota bacterium]